MKKYFYIFPIAFAAFFPAKTPAQSETQRAAIPPLIKTEWGQQAPFYYKTPVINGEHAKTGCVATAMSQLIYFHKHPAQGKQGVFSFDNFSFDFANTVFDYSAMKEKYNKNEDPSETSVREVSNLMYACGVTVNMDYGVESSSGNFAMIPGALSEWFLYPQEGMGMLLKEYFTLDEWEDIVYQELSEGRPVLYMGGNGESSHVFICDGYKDGKFHMNLGWYGEKNDYLPLSNLLTERVGKEGLWSMNSSQRIIRGVRTAEDKAPAPLATASSFSFDAPTNSFSLDGLSCYVNNTSIIPGLRIVNADSSKEYVVWAEMQTIINRSNSKIIYSVTLSDIEDGNYTIRPVYRLVDDSSEQPNVYPVYCKIVNTRYYNADILSNVITNPEEGSDIVVNISASEYNPASTFIKGENYGYGFTLFAENNGNTNITRVGVKFCNPVTQEDVRITNFTESLAPGECKTIYLAIPYTAEPGEYDMHIYDNNTKRDFCDPIRIVYHDSKEIISVADSEYRYMPLSEDSDEAMILVPKTSIQSIDNDGEFEIENSVSLNGKKYSITEVGPRLLYGRSDITSLIIPSTVKKIDASAFAGCQNIADISVLAKNPPALHSSAFDSQTISSAKLSVPNGSVELYKEAPVWKDFSYDVETETSDILAMESFSIAAESSANTVLILKTDQEFTGCQFKMTMPEGLQPVTNSVRITENLDGKNFVVSCGKIKDDNSYTVLMYSSNNTPYPVGENSILDFTFSSDSSFKGGSIILSDIVLSKEDGDVYNDVDIESSSCIVSLDVSTGNMEIEERENAFVDVYNIAGVLILRNVLSDTVNSSLTPGLYVIRHGNRAQKVMVK